MLQLLVREVRNHSAPQGLDHYLNCGDLHSQSFDFLLITDN